MQVNVMPGGELGINSLLYRPPDQNVISYMQNKLQNVYNSVKNVANNFVESANRLFHCTYSDEAVNKAKIYLAQSNYALNDMVITHVTPQTIKQINPFMQQLVMELPIVNNLCNRNLLHGYYGTYTDLEPNKKGEQRTVFREVTSGYMQFDKKYKNYNEDLGCPKEEDDKKTGFINHFSHSDERELHSAEKRAILALWNITENCINNEEDPTDINLN